MFLVRVVVGEQVDAGADAPGHGEQGDGLPLLHVSCVRRVEGIGLVSRGSRVPLWGSSQRAKKNRGGRPGEPARDVRWRRRDPIGDRETAHRDVDDAEQSREDARVHPRTVDARSNPRGNPKISGNHRNVTPHPICGVRVGARRACAPLSSSIVPPPDMLRRVTRTGALAARLAKFSRVARADIVPLSVEWHRISARSV